MIRVKCWCCGKSVRGGDDWAGRSAECPNCQSQITFPNGETPPFVEIAPKIEAPALPVAKRAPATRSLAIRPARVHWTYLATAAATLAIGYLTGREHIKYELRQSLSSFAESMQQALAPGSAPSFRPATESSAPTALEIESIDSRVTESNNVWHKHAWILKVRNDGNAAAVVNATIEWLDADGFVIDEDRQYGLTVPPQQVSTFRGYGLLWVPGAHRVDSVHASIGR